MDVVINLLIWVHIAAFVAGGSNSVVGPVIAGRMGSATPELKAGYYSIMHTLSKVGRAAMVTLLVTGPLIVWLKYGGFGGLNVWFWIKMALIVVMLVTIILGDINERKSQAGDVAAGGLAESLHKGTGLAFAALLLSAVFAFN